MAITFLEERRRLRFLIPIFGIVILITLLVIWRGVFIKKEPIFIDEDLGILKKKIEIDFQFLERPIFEELQSFEKISPFKEEKGRENPFIPY